MLSSKLLGVAFVVLKMNIAIYFGYGDVQFNKTYLETKENLPPCTLGEGGLVDEA